MKRSKVLSLITMVSISVWLGACSEEAGDGGSSAPASVDQTWPEMAAAVPQEALSEPEADELPASSEPSSAIARPADLPSDFPIPADAVFMTSSKSVNEGKKVILFNFTTKKSMDELADLYQAYAIDKKLEDGSVTFADSKLMIEGSIDKTDSIWLLGTTLSEAGVSQITVTWSEN
ncbi:hypothetical protein [Paenibacillus sp. Leaf72]|uniref:hypothetical protein n=1 Tax=Paenibacillus sp. Leaf72 TaxID=1736234 RepID=UPI0006FD4F09|nr:hypothetical protein [Paenibacillus sp. Leaf72]KQO01352.1 hypothetical protein ASF12_16105 [Paenibacillus sp. Leaf72]